MGYYTSVTLPLPARATARRPVFLRFDFAGDAPLSFQNPVEVITATRLGEVLPALAAVERASEAGFYAAGYVSYEAAPAFDSALETHPPGGQPLLWFGIFTEAETPEPEIPEPEPLEPWPRSAAPPNRWVFGTTETAYHAAVTTIRDHIAVGVTYQTNYTVRLNSRDHEHPDENEHQRDPYALYKTLKRHHRPPYASFLDTGDARIVSLSPELFFELEGARATARPMKGTAPRGRFPEEDERVREALQASPKERAENVMIADLIRNDLGRIARPGSVAVPELFTLETYPTFHTLSTTVTAELRPGTGLSRIFSALFPCGSVTGAPKVSTMKLIRTLEPTPRGVYCGAVGVVKPGGDATFSVPIRTLVVTPGGAEYGVGSGITWDSRAGAEYRELAVKASLITTPRPDFSLLETLLWNGRQYVRLKRHVARAAASAAFFGIPLDAADLERRLTAHALAHPGTPRRVRALVSQEGCVEIESRDFAALTGVLTATLALEPVDSQDVFLFHKTTHRAVYDARRHDAPNVGDVLLWNERGELTEFTIGNLVLEVGGEYLTPPQGAGLLAGTLRQEGLKSGLLEERTLYKTDLERARVWRINSLRGWERVDLIDLNL